MPTVNGFTPASIDAEVAHFIRIFRGLRASLAVNMKQPVRVPLFFLFAITLCVVPGFAADHPASSSATQAAPAFGKPPAIFPLKDIKPGMRGVAYTVFEGTQPEAMGVEILGVLKDMAGPKSDVILCRLTGAKVEYTGVVAGMSGSPVYIDGKLVGALAYRIGSFSKEPIGGITPIESMLEINELDASAGGGEMPPPPELHPTSPSPQAASKTSSADTAEPIDSFARTMTPIAAPLVFNGFSEETLQRFAPYFQQAGVMPVMGAGSASDEKQPEPIVPGSAVSAILVRGDMNISATCTVTYEDSQRLLACGHPLMQFGKVDLPMTKADVVATLASPLNAFKIVNTTETIGSFEQDRHTGIMGRFGKEAQMVPVTLRLHGPIPKEFHYEILKNEKLSGVAMMATVFNALQGMNEYGEEATYRMNGRIEVKGYPDVIMQDMFAPTEGAPTALAVALTVGERFGRIFQNDYDTPQIDHVDLDFDVVPERRWARLETARTDVTEARPGDEVVIETVLKPYRGDRIVRRIPIHIPTSVPAGTLRILVSDGETLDRTRRANPVFDRRMDLNATIAALNNERENSRVYVSLLEQNPQAMVEDKIMPTLPLSVMNVMEGMRGTQDMIVMGESAIDEASTPVDYVVSGAQVISLTIK